MATLPYGLANAPGRLVPPGDPIRKNIDMANEWMRAHPSATMEERMGFFYELVRSNADYHLPIAASWDYKRDRREYEDFGNFNFGVMGIYLGLTDDAVLWGAGVAQGINNGVSGSGQTLRSLIWEGARGDNPEDQEMIKQGIAYGKTMLALVPPVEKQSKIDFTDSAQFFLEAKLKVTPWADVANAEIRLNYYKTLPDQSPAETARLQEMTNRYWNEPSKLSPTGEPLNTFVTVATTSNTKTQIIWTRDDSTGIYTKTESITINNSDQEILSQNLTIYKYKSDRSPISATTYLYDKNGDLVHSGILTPTGSDSWVESSAGAPRPKSSDLIDRTSSNTAIIKSGGTLSDIVFLENRAGNPIQLKDILTANPDIENPDLVYPGQKIQVPRRNGSELSAVYADGTSVRNNPVSGEYSITAPNSSSDGGSTTYSRVRDGGGYLVTATSVTQAGAVSLVSESFQRTIDGPVEWSRVRTDSQESFAQRSPRGNSVELITGIDGVGVARVYSPKGEVLAEASVLRTGGIDGANGTLTMKVGDAEVEFGASFSTKNGRVDGVIALDSVQAIDGKALPTGPFRFDPTDTSGLGMTLEHLLMSGEGSFARSLLADLSPLAQEQTGHVAPKIWEVDLGNGQRSRVAELGDGRRAITIVNAQGEVVEVQDETTVGT